MRTRDTLICLGTVLATAALSAGGFALKAAHVDQRTIQNVPVAAQSGPMKDSRPGGLPFGQFRENSRGLTFGTLPTRRQQLESGKSSYTDAQMPDLVGVVMDDGGTGYVYSSALENAEGAPAKDPQQAIAGNDDPPTVLPAYASDGVTQMGTFTVG